MTRLCTTLVAAGVLCAVGAIVFDASAAYSGSVRRSVCASSGFIGLEVDPLLQIRHDCSLEVYNPLTPTLDHFWKVVIPVERKTSPTNAIPRVYVYGGSSPTSKVCMRAKSYDWSGAVVSMGLDTCTVGSLPVNQFLLHPSVTLLPDGMVEITVTATHGARLHTAFIAWTANGT